MYVLEHALAGNHFLMAEFGLYSFTENSDDRILRHGTLSQSESSPKKLVNTLQS